MGRIFFLLAVWGLYFPFLGPSGWVHQGFFSSYPRKPASGTDAGKGRKPTLLELRVVTANRFFYCRYIIYSLHSFFPLSCLFRATIRVVVGIVLVGLSIGIGGCPRAGAFYHFLGKTGGIVST